MQQLPDMNELMKIARSPAGKKLLAMLQAGSQAELSAIASEAAAGNIQEAGKKLSGLLKTEEAQNLLKQLESQS